MSKDNQNEELVFLNEGIDLAGNNVDDLTNEECSNFIIIKNH